nr:MAG TPA: hypothetical protein [Caudoviricetes sp.]
MFENVMLLYKSIHVYKLILKREIERHVRYLT